MNNLYKEMVRKPGDLCFEVSLESDKGLTMTDLSFALKFFVYGHPKNVCIHKDDLKVVEGKYYAVLNEHGFVNGVLFCEAEIVETINGINRIVSVRSNAGYMIGNCCQPSVDTSSCAHGYSLSLYKVEYVPQPIDPNPEEDQLVAEELFGEKLSLPELTADRAIADEHGNRIADTYETRQAVRNHIREVYNEQFNENPPLIMDGYITPQMLSESTKQLLENTGQSINNVPDGEDLTTKNGVLKLSDKPYNPGAYSGMGRVYLRKNLVGGQNLLTQAMVSKPNTIYILQYDYTLDGKSITIPEGCVLSYEGGSIRDGHINYTDTLIEGKESLNNVTEAGAAIHQDNEERKLNGQGMDCIILKKTPYLTQDMVSKPNTIYIIRYNYDLNGAEITIPEGCVLDFQGGSLCNGLIVGNNTAFKSNKSKIFDGISFEGKFALSDVFLDWFSTLDNDYTEPLRKSINLLRIGSFSGGNIILSAKEYKVKGITLESRINIIGKGKNNTIIKQLDGFNLPLIHIAKTVNINNIKDITLCGTQSNNVIEFEATDTSGNDKGLFMTDFSVDVDSSLPTSMKRTIIEECIITNGKNGVFINQGNVEIVISKTEIRANSGNGIHNYGYDNYFSNLDINNNKSHAIVEFGGNNKWSNIKAWFNGAGGLSLGCNCSQFTNIESQENYGDGYYLANCKHTILVNCVSDNDGLKNYSESSLSNYGFNFAYTLHNIICKECYVKSFRIPISYKAPYIFRDAKSLYLDIKYDKACCVNNPIKYYHIPNNINVLDKLGHTLEVIDGKIITENNIVIPSIIPLGSQFSIIIKAKFNSGWVISSKNNQDDPKTGFGVSSSGYIRLPQKNQDSLLLFCSGFNIDKEITIFMTYNKDIENGRDSFTFIVYDNNNNVLSSVNSRLYSIIPSIGKLYINCSSFSIFKYIPRYISYEDFVNNEEINIQGLLSFDSTMYDPKLQNVNTRDNISNPYYSQSIFDTTLNKPIWWTGTKWVDATGTEV